MVTTLLFYDSFTLEMIAIMQGLSWEFETVGKSSKFKGETQRYQCSKIAKISGCQASLAPVLTQAL